VIERSHTPLEILILDIDQKNSQNSTESNRIDVIFFMHHATLIGQIKNDLQCAQKSEIFGIRKMKHFAVEHFHMSQVKLKDF